MNRAIDITLTEEECDLLIDLMLKRQNVCRANANAARHNGYGSGRSLEKEQQWIKKEDELVQLCNKFTDKLL